MIILSVFGDFSSEELEFDEFLLEES